MKLKPFSSLAAVALCAVAASALAPRVALAQGGPKDNVRPATGVDAAQVWARFVAKETEFQRAFWRYTFRREAIIQGVGRGGQVAGEYLRLSHLSFDSEGHMIERVIKMPTPSVAPSQADLEDLNGAQLFVLEAPKLAQYDFRLAGAEKIDELNLYVFDVSPKPQPKKSKERFFQGRVWIDDQDFQVVKARGKGWPESRKEVFPTFVYYREHDGRYWVPSRVDADDELVIPATGEVFRIRMRVRYTDYEKK